MDTRMTEPRLDSTVPLPPHADANPLKPGLIEEAARLLEVRPTRPGGRNQSGDASRPSQLDSKLPARSQERPGPEEGRREDPSKRGTGPQTKELHLDWISPTVVGAQLTLVGTGPFWQSMPTFTMSEAVQQQLQKAGASMKTVWMGELETSIKWMAEHARTHPAECPAWKVPTEWMFKDGSRSVALSGLGLVNRPQGYETFFKWVYLSGSGKNIPGQFPSPAYAANWNEAYVADVLSTKAMGQARLRPLDYLPAELSAGFHGEVGKWNSAVASHNAELAAHRAPIYEARAIQGFKALGALSVGLVGNRIAEQHLFEGVPSSIRSTFIDAASTGMMFIPRGNLLLRGASMTAIHVGARYWDSFDQPKKP